MAEVKDIRSGITYEGLGIPSGQLALWWLITSEIVIFGGLICCFVLYRWLHPEWAAEAHHTLNNAGALNTIVLLTSSLTVVLAHNAAELKQTDKACKFLALTVLGGMIFLVVKTYEYSHEIHAGMVPSRSMFWSFYYAITGLHASHVVAGMISMLSIMPAVKRGENLQRVEYVGLYWHFVDIVWIFLFPLLYLAS
jgi:heme/copper-type cytochrome/quinol oxidase subunit 3